MSPFCQTSDKLCVMKESIRNVRSLTVPVMSVLVSILSVRLCGMGEEESISGRPSCTGVSIVSTSDVSTGVSIVSINAC